MLTKLYKMNKIKKKKVKLTKSINKFTRNKINVSAREVLE